MKRRKLLLVLAAVVAACLAALATHEARAAFPGKNGKVFFESSRSGRTHIYSTNPGGMATELVGIKDNNDEEEPAVSPDGSRVAFVYGRDIWVMNDDGTNPRRLTTNSDFNDEPAWSPDGTRIAFTNGNFDIVSMNADGTGKSNLTNSPDQEYDPAFSPDGTKIAFQRDDNDGGPPEILAINSDGSGTPANLTNDPARDEHPDWQPVPQCTITGSGTLNGTPGKDVLCGSIGDDTINGAGGNDIILGGGGKDRLVGSSGNDTLNGGSGSDTVAYGGSTAVRANLTTGFATGVGSDSLLGVENLTGSGAGDNLRGSAAGNTLVGGKGADKLYGLDGPDTINSRDGAIGNDTLSGGPGTDNCIKDATEKAITSCEN